MRIRDAIQDFYDSLTGRQLATVIAILIVVIAVAISGGSLISHFRIKGLEKKVAASKERADLLEWQAAQAEKEAAVYQARIGKLEGSLLEIQKLARTQDENLEKFQSVVVGARADAERASRVRSIASTAEQLCERLREVGHPCESGSQ